MNDQQGLATAWCPKFWFFLLVSRSDFSPFEIIISGDFGWFIEEWTYRSQVRFATSSHPCIVQREIGVCVCLCFLCLCPRGLCFGLFDWLEWEAILFKSIHSFHSWVSLCVGSNSPSLHWKNIGKLAIRSLDTRPSEQGIPVTLWIPLLVVVVQSNTLKHFKYSKHSWKQTRRGQDATSWRRRMGKSREK